MSVTGADMNIHGMTIGRVRGGKLVEGWNIFDQYGMLQQLGAIPPAPAV
jgi:hypothetical protein